MSKVYTVDAERWASLSIFDQMGNIYSEVGRSFSAQRRNNPVDCLAATNRAIDLFDATVDSLVTHKSPKSKEVLRAKEQYLEALNNKSTSQAAVQSLDRYFMQFAVAARLNR